MTLEQGAIKICGETDDPLRCCFITQSGKMIAIKETGEKRETCHELLAHLLGTNAEELTRGGWIRCVREIPAISISADCKQTVKQMRNLRRHIEAVIEHGRFPPTNGQTRYMPERGLPEKEYTIDMIGKLFKNGSFTRRIDSETADEVMDYIEARLKQYREANK